MEQAAPSDLDEVRLLRDCRRGEPSSVRQLLDEHLPVVYGFVLARLGGNEAAAEDVMQETVMEAMKSADSFRGDSKLSTWLCAIARRRVARFFERERKQAAAQAGLQLVESEPEGTERDAVLDALARLSPIHRQVLVMKYLDKMPVEEIAQELGRSRIQVQSLLQRARDAFKRMMESEDG